MSNGFLASLGSRVASLGSRVAEVLGALAMVIVTAGVALFLYRDTFRECWRDNIVEMAELLGLSVAAALSTMNYISSGMDLGTWLHQERKTELKPRIMTRQGAFVALHLACFLLAFNSLFEPGRLIFALLIIYVGYCFNNLWYDRLLSKGMNERDLTAGRRERKGLLGAARMALVSENAPAALAYCFLLILFFIELGLGNRTGGESLHVKLSAVAAGAATFHLAASALKYRQVLSGMSSIENMIKRSSSRPCWEMFLKEGQVITRRLWWRTGLLLVVGTVLAWFMWTIQPGGGN